MGRVGIGQDSHKFDAKKPLVLGGVLVAKSGGFLGNSDSDVILHSLCNALSSAIGGNSISTWSDEMCKRGIVDSKKYVEAIFKMVKAKKYKVSNVTVAVEGKKPYIELKIATKIKICIADLLEVDVDQVGITFTSGEGLTPFGKGLGMQSICVVLLANV